MPGRLDLTAIGRQEDWEEPKGRGPTPDVGQRPGPQLDARQALVYMLDELDELLDDQQIAS